MQVYLNSLVLWIMKEITAKQTSVLVFIKDFLQNKGFFPSYRDIQDAFNYKSINAAVRHVEAIEKKGFIKRIPGRARAFVFTDKWIKEDDEIPENAEEVVSIPLYGAIPAGYPDRVESAGEIDQIQVDIQTAGIQRATQSYALKVRGDSMIDAAIYDGDTVIVETGIARDGDIVAALIDEETTLKRFIHKSGEHPYLKAENPDYPSLYPVENLVIQGIAKAVVRSLN